MQTNKFKIIFYYSIWFLFLFIWLETIFHVAIFDNANVFLPIMMSIPMAILCSVFTHLFSRKTNRIIGFILTFIICFFFDAEAIYYTVFHTFMAPFSLISMAGNAVNFKDVAVSKALTQIPLLLAINIPLVLYWFVTKPQTFLQHKTFLHNALGVVCSFLFQLLAIICIFSYGTSYYTPYDLYYDRFLINDAIDSLGVITSVRLDAMDVLGQHVPFLTRKTIVPRIAEKFSLLDSDESIDAFDSTNASEEDNSDESSQAPEEVFTSDTHHMLDYDFESLAMSTSDNNTIKQIHTYMSTQKPDAKNEYTGMFEDYNIIWIVAESLWSYAIRPDTTPTLYKLVNEGFVFEHYYTPLWYGSTTGGEFSSYTGLIPLESGRFSFDLTGEQSNDMRTVLSMKLPSLGYFVGGYHSYWYHFYNRHISHPNMGMSWWGYGNGYEAETKENGEYLWPQSDLTLVQETIDFYMNDNSPFFAYYMSFSGHSNWGLNGENAMSERNWDAVKDLEYSETAKCYLAANIELDKAVEYLIEQLEKRGLLENTLIVISPDHIPYTDKEMCDELAGHTLEESIEWAENNLVIWSASMKEPITVEKYCSNIDILPTVCNLLNVEYDSRLLIGHDILSDTSQLVMFPDHSWISDVCIYYAQTGQLKYLYENTELPKGYINSMNRIVREKFQISEDIVLKDYYSYLP